MTSLLQPIYTLTLGSQQWTEQVVSLDVTLAAAPLIDVARACFPASAPLTCEVGDPALLALDNGENEANVFAGSITSIRHTFEGIEVTALNAGGTLAQLRPAVTYEKINAGTLIRNLCAEIGADTGTIDDGVALAFYAADPSRTAWEHIARVAAWSGTLVAVDPDNAVQATVINATQAELALRYGRELLHIATTAESAPVVSFVVAGESGAGDTATSDALRPTTDFFGGSRPDGPDAEHRWRFVPALRTAQGAATAGAALTRAYRSSRKRGALRAFLQPKLRPGMIFEIQELPTGFSGGPFWISQLRHRLRRDGAQTSVQFRTGGDSFDPLTLLGSLSNTLGGGF